MPAVPRPQTQERVPERADSIVIPLAGSYPVIVQYFKPEGTEIRIVCPEKLNPAKIHAGIVRVLQTLRVEKHKFAMEQTALKNGEQKWQQTQTAQQQENQTASKEPLAPVSA